jgi:uncharacterized protein YceH (UPF0502 family)
MELSQEEIRVLGCLVEKERTTPDQYPLSTNALRLACNQKTNREPIVEYNDVVVDQTMLALRQAGLARTVSGMGMRASKHKHVLGEAWGLSDQELALLCVLMLRGPQTVGELRGRSDRMSSFVSLGEVEAVLGTLAGRPDPLVVRLERRPGQKEERWAHLLTGEAPEWDETPATGWAPRANASSGSGGGSASALAQRVTELEEDVRSLTSDLEVLRRQFDALCETLGEHPD